MDYITEVSIHNICDSMYVEYHIGSSEVIINIDSFVQSYVMCDNKTRKIAFDAVLYTNHTDILYHLLKVTSLHEIKKQYINFQKSGSHIRGYKETLTILSSYLKILSL